MAEYKTSADIDEESAKAAAAAAESAPKTVELTDQQKVEEKLAQKGFLEYASKKTEFDGENLTDMEPGKILELAGEYETNVAPTIEQMKKFFSSEFFSKLPAIEGKTRQEASESIETFLVNQAIKEPKAFEKHTENIAKFKDLTEKSTKLEAELSRSGINEGSWSEAKQNIDKQVRQTEKFALNNLEARGSAVAEIQGQKIYKKAGIQNRLTSFRNKVFSLGRERRSDAEINEENQFNAANKDLTERQKALDTLQDQMKTKEAYDAEVGNIKSNLLSALGPMKELRDLLMKATTEVIKKGSYSPEKAGETFSTVGEQWGEQGDESSQTFDSYTKELSSNMTEIFKKEIANQAVSAEKSVNPTKLQEFSSFLAKSVKNEDAKDLVSTCLTGALDSARKAGNNSKVAHLSMMSRRLQAVTF